MLLHGRTQREMAAALGVAKTTVGRDVAAVRAEWQARRVELMDSVGAEDLARTDAILRAVWPDVVLGKLLAIDRALNVLAYRAKVLGLAAPQKLDLGVGAELANVLAALGADDAPAA